MVSSLSIACMFITLLIVFLFPIGLLIYMYRKERIALKAVLVGAIVFVVFQLLTRIPLLSALAGQEWYQNLVENPLFYAIVIGGLSGTL